MMNLNNLFKQILLLSLTGSILSMAILLIKNIFGKKLSAKVHYFIWFLLILKLIIPLNYQSIINPFNYINLNPQKLQMPYSVTQNIVSSPNNTSIKSNDSTAAADLQKSNNNNKPTAFEFGLNIASEIWLAGVLLFLFYIIFINIVLSINIKKSKRCKRPDINYIFHEAELKLDINSKVTLVYNKNLKSPSVYGIIHPKILISESIVNKLSPRELNYIFLHELNHVKRKDLLLNIVIILLQAVYWFNPFILYSLSRFKQDCELACDEDTLSILNSNEIHEYGKTIINMLQIASKHHLSAGALGFSNKFNKRRIIMITLFNKKSIAATVLALSLLFAAGCSISPNKPSVKSNTADTATTVSQNSTPSNQSVQDDNKNNSNDTSAPSQNTTPSIAPNKNNTTTPKTNTSSGSNTKMKCR